MWLLNKSRKKDVDLRAPSYDPGPPPPSFTPGPPPLEKVSRENTIKATDKDTKPKPVLTTSEAGYPGSIGLVCATNKRENIAFNKAATIPEGRSVVASMPKLKAKTKPSNELNASLDKEKIKRPENKAFLRKKSVDKRDPRKKTGSARRRSMPSPKELKGPPNSKKIFISLSASTSAITTAKNNITLRESDEDRKKIIEGLDEILQGLEKDIHDLEKKYISQ